MGDFADMVVDGIVCQLCGEFMGDACGHPRTCSGCSTAKPKPYDCQFCHRGFSSPEARSDHERAVHAKRLAARSGNG